MKVSNGWESLSRRATDERIQVIRKLYSEFVVASTWRTLERTWPALPKRLSGTFPCGWLPDNRRESWAEPQLQRLFVNCSHSRKPPTRLIDIISSSDSGNSTFSIDVFQGIGATVKIATVTGNTVAENSSRVVPKDSKFNWETIKNDLIRGERCWESIVDLSFSFVFNLRDDISVKLR